MKPITLRISQNGRISIPKEVRQELDLEDGDELLATVEGKRLIIESEAALLERLYQTVGKPTEDQLVSDELIAERRAEARHEAKK